jgi:phospholipid/cholesterol/gamma-HCH transport system permease protein
VATIDYNVIEKDNLQMVISGRLDAETVAPLWPQAVNKLVKIKPAVLEVQADKIDYCDGAGIALLIELKRKQQQKDRAFKLHDLKPQFQQLLEIFDPGPVDPPLPEQSFLIRTCENVGRQLVSYLIDTRQLIGFVGELFVKLILMMRHPRTLRLTDTFLLTEKAGADAVGLVALLGFLIGMILAFQSAIPMGQFGAQIFVADLVVLSLFRELGPLITAVILASRSGSAFAAEIGTMKVNEEIDALTTMGVDPVRFLVIPRVIAAVFVIPLLTMFNNLFGLIGCGVVMLSLGFSPRIYIEEIQQAASLGDLVGGLVKTFVFGILIAAIGCLRGLQTKSGASAVGDSATKAVVSGIVAIVVVDGIFAVIYYFLGV